MARKSRKKPVDITRQTGLEEYEKRTESAEGISEEKAADCYRTAVYVRLSLENSGKDDDGDSIENQKEMCMEYLKEHPDLVLYDSYVDNGEKGTDFDRPEFSRMMEDIRVKKVNCVLVKDLSRFGRDYIEAGNYLEKIFPFMGVRFISVTDHYDSLSAKKDENNLVVPLKNMINAAYAKDISRKIITSFRARQEKCEILPSFAPYGYVKSKTKAYRYEVDELVAPYVKLIYKWKLEGRSYSEITDGLNKLGAVPPAKRKYDLGIFHSEKHNRSEWNDKSVRHILFNPTYVGCIVYGRMPRALYNGERMRRTDPGEWMVFPDMHEAIISREDFDKVQEMMKAEAEKRKTKLEESKTLREKQVDLYEGRIFCGDCGRRMLYIRVGTGAKNHNHTRYICSGYARRRGECSTHTIWPEEVNTCVISVLQGMLRYTEGLEAQLKRLVKNEGKDIAAEYHSRIFMLRKELAETGNKRNELLEYYMDAVISKDEYRHAKATYDIRCAKTEEHLQKLEKEYEDFQNAVSGKNEWIRMIHMAGELKEISREIVDALIKRVLVYENRRVEVELSFSEERSLLERFIELVGGGNKNGMATPEGGFEE